MMEFFNALSDWLWTYIVITMLVGCALYFTWNLRAVQFTMLPLMLRNLFMPPSNSPSMGEDQDSPLLIEGEVSEKGAIGRKISSFQAFAISLSSRVGTGNLAGVASAIFVGGPGAVFWMWVMALLGAATAFMEATLAQLFKRKGKDSFFGGPAYYMKYGLRRPWMGILFAVLIIYFLEVMKFLTVIVVVKVAQAVPNLETVATSARELSTIAFVE
jgi:AGCS family alanine or glycine:cation symporter